MKKIVLALLCLIPVLGFTSCDDEKDLPDVDFSLTVSGGEVYDNQLYVVADSTLSIDAVNVVNNDGNKGVAIPYVDYYVDGVFIGRSVAVPFGISIPTEVLEMPAGKYTLLIACPVYAVDKEAAFASLSYALNVVPTEDDMPQGGTATHVGTPAVRDNDLSK